MSDATLKPLSSLPLSQDEQKMLAWMRSAKWEAQTGARDPIPYKAKVPEFYGGVRMYRLSGGAHAGAHDALEIFIKKLQYQHIIGKQEMYPVAVEGNARYLSLKKADLDNLGIGQEEEDDE